MRRVYMDANATTPLLPEVMEAMRPYWMEHFGNASSIHQHGQQARTAVDRARETMARFFNCHDAEVVFNSGGTEGDNTAILACCTLATISSRLRSSIRPFWKQRSAWPDAAWRRPLWRLSPAA